MRVLDEMAAAAMPAVGSNDVDIERLAEVPLIDQPGQRYRVFDASGVVGQIICKITGKSLLEVVRERIIGPLDMTDTDWSVPHEKQHRIASLSQAAPYLTNRLWGNRLTGEHAGNTSWLGWVAKPIAQRVSDELPSNLQQKSLLFSTALDQLKFHSMLLCGGLAASGQRVLSQTSVQLMTTDQLPVIGRRLADANFNSHARDRSHSSGSVSPQFGVTAAGQGVGLGMEVVTRPSESRLAGSKGTFSSWDFHGTECWSDPALELSVFIGTQLIPFCALPEMRQEIAGIVYGSLVSSAAAKHFVREEDQAGGGWMGQIMNGVMMMSMMGGGGMMAGMGPAA